MLPVRFGRKRALPSCPNPLFFQWLTELRDEAKEKGLKIQYNPHCSCGEIQLHQQQNDRKAEACSLI
uniref:Uncharacterized protein n=1 Tax=Xiphophorus couchianus TaxID=32473 RepID=A0A3B5LD17_9TELE